MITEAKLRHALAEEVCYSLLLAVHFGLMENVSPEDRKYIGIPLMKWAMLLNNTLAELHSYESTIEPVDNGDIWFIQRWYDKISGEKVKWNAILIDASIYDSYEELMKIK